MHIFRITLALLAFALLTNPIFAEQVDSIPARSGLISRLNLPAQAGFRGSDALVSVITLPAISHDLTSDIPGVPKTGVVYVLPEPVTAANLGWERVGGYFSARIRFVADSAARLRLHLIFPRENPTVEIHLKGSSDSMPTEPISSAEIETGDRWLPTTLGNAVDMEIAMTDDQNPDSIQMTIDSINIIPEPAQPATLGAMVPHLTGAAQKPQRDLACWSANPNYAALRQAAAATAMITFISDGASYQCTGSLLADKGGTQIPWFTTANHCVSGQVTADTIEFEWNYQATACGQINTDPNNSQTSGGAKMLYTDVNRDISFLRLNKPPGPSTVLSGWSTSIQKGDTVWGVHHPRGDHTMVNLGKVTALTQTIEDLSNPGKTHVLDDVLFSVGGVEDGSSGSGLFAVVNGKAYWKGTLFGSAPNDYQDAGYSHFAGYYDVLRPWLEGCRLPWGGTVPADQSVNAYSAKSALDCSTVAQTRTCTDGVLGGDVSYGYKTCRSGCLMPWDESLSLADGQNTIAYTSDCADKPQKRICNDGTLSGSYNQPACLSLCPSTWSPSGPTADAAIHSSSTGNVGDRLRLDGSLSCNANPPGPKRRLRYFWTALSNKPKNADGSDVRFSLRARRGAFPSFIPPLPGDYEFQLTVTNLADPAASSTATVKATVNGAINVTNPTEGTLWTLGDMPEIAWTFQAISNKKRFNVFLVTNPDTETSKTFLLKRRVKPDGEGTGNTTVNLRRTTRSRQMVGLPAKVKVCLPRIGRNDPVCGWSANLSIQDNGAL